MPGFYASGDHVLPLHEYPGALLHRLSRDIGVPASGPMDFSAWFEAYLGDGWYTFDPRNNRPRIGRLLMAYGRDAADVALLTSFGPSRLERFTVWTDAVAEESLATIQSRPSAD